MANPIIIDKELIDKTAFDIVQRQGIEMLSARNIANQIGCSTKPIYRVYENMDELKKKVLETTAKYLQSYISVYHKTGNTLLDSALAYISFICLEKQLFRFIIMTDNQQIMDSAYYKHEFSQLLKIECKDKHFTSQKLEEVAEQIIIYTYGLAMMLYMNTKNWSEEMVTNNLKMFVENMTTGMEEDTQ